MGCRVWNARENSSDRAFGFERGFTSEGLAVIPQESTARFFSFEEKDGIIITQSVIIKEFRSPARRQGRRLAYAKAQNVPVGSKMMA